MGLKRSRDTGDGLVEVGAVMVAADSPVQHARVATKLKAKTVTWEDQLVKEGEKRKGIQTKMSQLAHHEKLVYVKQNNKDLEFMKTVVAIDRAYLELAHESIAENEELKQIAINTLFSQCIDVQNLKPLPIFGEMESYLTWQEPKAHQTVREEFLRKILDLIVHKKLNAPNIWFERCNRILPKVEFHLYMSSKNIDDYSDLSTLKKRVQLFLAAKYAAQKASAVQELRTKRIKLDS